MALLSVRCMSCEHRYPALTGNVIADLDAERCPKCFGTQLETLVPTRVNARASTIDVSKMEQDEIDMHVENRQWMEANAEKLLSGEMTDHVGRRCPAEFVPQVPEHLRKRYF